MRVLELSTRVNVISRGDDRTATAAAAYRACCVIECERLGVAHDYTRKHGLETAEIVLPADAPAWARDRAKLWNAAEMRETNKDARAKSAVKADAQVAREFFFTFPHELTAASRIAVARMVAQHLADTHGIAADLAIHAPGREGDERNWHCHILTTTRRLTAKGLGAKAREWVDKKTGPKLSKNLRAFIAQALNEALAAEGKADLVRVEHRSFKDRGSGQTPTKHQGPAKTHALRRQQRQMREAWLAEHRAGQHAMHERERAALQARHDFALEARTADLSRRMHEGAARIRQELADSRRADPGPTGLRRVFMFVTGRAMREAFERQARDAQRVLAARAKLADLRASLNADLRAFRAGQGAEMSALAERHARHETQLRQALATRQTLDLAAERQARAASNDRQRPPPDAREHGRSLSL